MITDEIKVIDVDTHVTEPYDLFTSRVSTKKWGDKVPHVRNIPWETARHWDPSADPEMPRDIWILNGQPSSPIGITTMAGWRQWPPAHPSTLEEFDPGSYDSTKRLERMDEYGMYAHVIYPNVAGFGNQNFLKLEDPELMLACVRAYNDFLHDWCAVDPDRLLPIMAVPFWDVDETVAEIHRCFKLGHKGVLFPQQPHLFENAPMLGDPHWNPLWEVAVELDLPISFHIGSGNMELGLLESKMASYGRMAAFTELSVDIFLKNAMQLNDLILSGVLARYPDIKFISVESGIGWVPFALEALDYQFHGNDVAEEHPEFDLLPSEYFARNVYACYWFEQLAPRRLIDEVGADNILFETDFPHPTSLYGDEVHARIKGGLSDCEESVRRKILWENGQKLYKVEEPTADDEAKRELALAA